MTRAERRLARLTAALPRLREAYARAAAERRNTTHLFSAFARATAEIIALKAKLATRQKEAA